MDDHRRAIAHRLLIAVIVIAAVPGYRVAAHALRAYLSGA